MVRILAVTNGENWASEIMQGSAGLMYMLGMIVVSISIMSMLIFACAGHSSGKARKRWGGGGGVGGGGDGGGGGGGGGCGGGGGGC
ncbi:hypothetical protein CASFOL_025241 [Castilleja foliolosa]|uniref:Glycine-rich protein n=1 Tax=Castilleja foliolosa TaxID=1961234 RepID=A0ABD3CS28_9LAMI